MLILHFFKNSRYGLMIYAYVVLLVSDIGKKKMGPLEGIRVIDLTAVVLGPLSTQILADYGADVIKIEPPNGDLMRANGVSKSHGMSSTFMNLNRNKRSLVLDLKNKDALESIYSLIENADVLVHNMRVNAINRLGLSYYDVIKINPQIVYCAATGFGEDGSHAGLPAFDDVIQGACGLASLMGHESGEPEYPPTLLADKVAGFATANAVLAALVCKSRTGEGQYVEVPMFETMVAFTMLEHMGGKGFEPAIGPAGYTRLLKGGRRPTATKDGFLAILPYTESQWRDFFYELGYKDIFEKYDLSNRYERNKRIQELYEDLRLVSSNFTNADLISLCRQFDIPVTEIFSIDNIDEHEHAKSVKLFEFFEHPSEGTLKIIRPTALFSKTPSRIERPAPHLGQHNHEILGNDIQPNGWCCKNPSS